MEAGYRRQGSILGLLMARGGFGWMCFLGPMRRAAGSLIDNKIIGVQILGSHLINRQRKLYRSPLLLRVLVVVSFASSFSTSGSSSYPL